MPKPRKRKARAPYKVADELFSKIIRLRDQAVCQNCGKTDFPQCAHGFSRSYRAIRWDERNAWCLCRGCHTYFTHHPLEWDEWLIERLGERLHRDLKRQALKDPNPDPVEVVDWLRARLAEMEVAACSPAAARSVTPRSSWTTTGRSGTTDPSRVASRFGWCISAEPEPLRRAVPGE